MSTDQSVISATPEALIWKGRPSQLLNSKVYLPCMFFSWLLFPLIFAAWTWAKFRTTKYILTNERLRVRKGVFSRKTKEIELYTIKSITVHEPWYLRVFRLGNIILKTYDREANDIVLPGVREAHWVKDQMRMNMEYLKEKRRIRAVG